MLILPATTCLMLAAAPAAAQSLRWSTGPAGGGWFGLNQAIAAHVAKVDPGLRIEVIPGGGKDNPTSVQSGAAQFGTSIDFLSAAALAGRDPYGAAHPALRSIGAGWSPLPFHLVHVPGVTGDLPTALKSDKLRIGLPPASTSDELTFRRVLAFYGTDYERLRGKGATLLHGSYDDLVKAFGAGEIDYVFGATTTPADAIAKMGAAPRGGQLAALPDALIDSLSRQYGYGQGSIAADAYPSMQKGPVRTTFMETVFLVSSDVPEDTVYRVTKALIAPGTDTAAVHPALRKFDKAKAWQNLPLPLHPGAERAYREAGYMK